MRLQIRTRQSPGHGLDNLHHPPTPSRKCSIRHGPHAGVSTRHATGVNVASTHTHDNQMGPIPTDHNTPGPSRLHRRQAAGHPRGAKPHITVSPSDSRGLLIWHDFGRGEHCVSSLVPLGFRSPAIFGELRISRHGIDPFHRLTS